MRKFLLAATAVLVGMASVAVANDEEFSEVEYYRKLAEKQLAEAKAEAEPEVTVEVPVVYVEPPVEEPPAPPPPVARAVAVVTPPPLPELPEPVHQYQEVVYDCTECEEEAPKNVIVAIPQYYHSSSKNDAKFEVGGQRLKSAKSTANGAGFSLVYSHRFSDVISLGLSYQYGFMHVSGGTAVPDVAGATGWEDSRWHSHVIGSFADLNFQEYGKLQLSVVQGFDRVSGNETVGLDKQELDGYGTNVTSLMAWYEKDFDLACGFKLTPYGGWRSLFVKVKNQLDWNTGSRKDDSLWVHLLSGGLKATYQKDSVGFTLRAGVNHRLTSDDLPGYGNRAVAPGVVQFSHRANMDRTVGTFGAGINFAIKKRAMVGVNYDGFVGKNTSAHMGTLTFALPF